MVGPFLPPLKNDKLLPWWKKRLVEANEGKRVIVLLLPETAPGKKPLGTDLRGLAMLELSELETGSFRGHIDAVLVHQKFRRQGGARALVQALEYEAAKRGRTLLVGILLSRATPQPGSCPITYIPVHTLTLKRGRCSLWIPRRAAPRRRLSLSSDMLKWARSRASVRPRRPVKRGRRFSTKTWFLRRNSELGCPFDMDMGAPPRVTVVFFFFF